MRSTIFALKATPLTICFILLTGTFVFAQQTNSNNAENLSATPKAAVSEADKNSFYELTKRVTFVFSKGELTRAKEFAETLLEQADTMPDDWNYGNAVHVANLVLGHVALASGDVAAAKRFLLAAGKTPGSPQLDSFGPNMRLAKALLEKGETETVLEYFDLCDKFWKPRFSATAEWKAAIRKNETPDFGANLRYQFHDAKQQ
ncbi:MAG TPA: hypothetical protein VIL74_04355 [Pyrinomonadaceae bacterium]|jgi:hypothetical protein